MLSRLYNGGLIMDNDLSLLLGFFVNNFGTDHIFWIFYVFNLIFAAIAYKLGFARELPIGKSIIVYILLALGNFILTIFSIMKLPITESLIIISAVLGIYRYRLYKERGSKKNKAT